jgi:chorismate-pyruvate lyase
VARHGGRILRSFSSASPVNDPANRPSAESELFARNAARLAGLFLQSLDELGRFEAVSMEELPTDYRSLLAHHDHMTVALEAFHNSLVDVEALFEWRDDASYARCSLLRRQSDGKPIQFGIMRIWLGDLPQAAQEEITARRIPLGRVLIRHNIFREVEVLTLWRIIPGLMLRQHLCLTGDSPIYGRTAQILVDERPTVQLLEIVTLNQ